MTLAANATMLDDLVSVFWDHLAGDSRYTALGLQEFRKLDGRILPIDHEDGSIAADALPAIYVETLTLDFPEDARTLRHDELVVEMVVGIIFASTAMHEHHSATLAAAALMTVLDVIGNRASHMNNMGGGDKISSYDYTPIGLAEAVSTANPSEALYWEALFRVTLRKQRAMPQN